MQIPLESHELTLKSLTPAALGSLARVAFCGAFTGFIGPNSASDPRFQAYLAQTDFGDTDPVDRPGGKLPAPRRFAGDHSLGRGRYYSICHDIVGGDDGTLVRELAAYGDPSTTPGMTIEEHLGSEPFLRLSFEARRNVVLEFFDGAREAVLPLRVDTERLDNVLDLRKPSVQTWFVETFGEPTLIQGDPEAGYDGVERSIDEISRQWRRPVSFFEMLPVLMSPELGGTRTSQIVGLRLRSWGCQALIYPSARNAVGVYLDDRRIVSSRGWNLLRCAPSTPAAVRYKQYQVDPWMSQNATRFGFSSEQTGRFGGSWLIKPPMPSHELHMKFVYSDRLPLEALWPAPRDYPEITEPPMTDEDIARAEFPAFARMREEFREHYARLGPEHPETLELATWLAENDRAWYSAFLELTERHIEE